MQSLAEVAISERFLLIKRLYRTMTNRITDTLHANDLFAHVHRALKENDFYKRNFHCSCAFNKTEHCEMCPLKISHIAICSYRPIEQTHQENALARINIIERTMLNLSRHRSSRLIAPTKKINGKPLKSRYFLPIECSCPQNTG